MAWTPIVDGEIVMFERQIATIDEAAPREELASLMPAFRLDFAPITEANQRVVPYLSAASDRLKSQTWESIDLSHRDGASHIEMRRA